MISQSQGDVLRVPGPLGKQLQQSHVALRALSGCLRFLVHWCSLRSLHFPPNDYQLGLRRPAFAFSPDLLATHLIADSVSQRAAGLRGRQSEGESHGVGLHLGGIRVKSRFPRLAAFHKQPAAFLDVSQ